jgi:hypothetical protein
MKKEQLGTLLLILGVLAWVVYYALKLLTSLDLPFGLFLAWHLAGVLPGSLLRGSKVISWLRRSRLKKDSVP